MSLGISEEGNLGIHHSVIALFCTFTFLFCCLIPLNPFHTQCLLNSNLLPIDPIIITIILGKRGWYTDTFAHNMSFLLYNLSFWLCCFHALPAHGSWHCWYFHYELNSRTESSSIWEEPEAQWKVHTNPWIMVWMVGNLGIAAFKYLQWSTWNTSNFSSSAGFSITWNIWKSINKNIF